MIVNIDIPTLIVGIAFSAIVITMCACCYFCGKRNGTAETNSLNDRIIILEGKVKQYQEEIEKYKSLAETREKTIDSLIGAVGPRSRAISRKEEISEKDV